MFVDGVPIERIMILGRWASLSSCRRYVQAGRALMLSAETPVAIARAATDLAADVIGSLALAQEHGVQGGSG